jgi:integrase
MPRRTLTRLRDGIWYSDFGYRDPLTGRRKRCRLSTGVREGESRLRAERIAAGWKRELEQPIDPNQRRASFSGFADYWMRLRVVPHCTPATCRSYETILRVHLVPWFGDRELRSIELHDLERLVAEKLDTLAVKSVRNHLGVLSSLFSAAKRWGYIERDLTTELAWPTAPEPELEFWDRREGAKFLEACEKEEPALFPIAFGSLRTGIRQGEAIGLQTRDVQLQQTQINVQRSVVRGVEGPPKSKAKRIVPMSPALTAFMEQRLQGLEPTDLVFPGPGRGWWTPDQLKRPFQRATQAAGVPRIRWHDLRHSYASQLVIAGVPLVVVQRLLGHSDIRTTMRYAHLRSSSLAQHVAILDAPVADDEDVPGGAA